MLPFAQDLSIVVDGMAVPLVDASADPLTRSVINSLFSWRRAAPDDVLPDGTSRMGWWGDNYASATGDRWGSRLWLLVREPLTAAVIVRARGYAAEALQWMLDDGVASRLEVTAERFGLSGLALGVTIWRRDGSQRVLNFSDAWKVLADG